MGGIASLVKQAENVRKAGRYGDTMLAHITPREAGILKLLGGSGSINPKTGIIEFYNATFYDHENDKTWYKDWITYLSTYYNTNMAEGLQRALSVGVSPENVARFASDPQLEFYAYIQSRPKNWYDPWDEKKEIIHRIQMNASPYWISQNYPNWNTLKNDSDVKAAIATYSYIEPDLGFYLRKQIEDAGIAKQYFVNTTSTALEKTHAALKKYYGYTDQQITSLYASPAVKNYIGNPQNENNISDYVTPISAQDKINRDLNNGQPAWLVVQGLLNEGMSQSDITKLVNDNVNFKTALQALPKSNFTDEFNINYQGLSEAKDQQSIGFYSKRIQNARSVMNAAGYSDAQIKTTELPYTPAGKIVTSAFEAFLGVAPSEQELQSFTNKIIEKGDLTQDIMHEIGQKNPYKYVEYQIKISLDRDNSSGGVWESNAEWYTAWLAKSLVEQGITDLNDIERKDITSSRPVYFADTNNVSGYEDFTTPVYTNKRTGKVIENFNLPTTYAGEGGTSAELFIENGKPVIVTRGFETSDADLILPVVAFAAFIAAP